MSIFDCFRYMLRAMYRVLEYHPINKLELDLSLHESELVPNVCVHQLEVNIERKQISGNVSSVLCD